MTAVTIFGAGNMGRAIAGIVVDGGNTVQTIGRGSLVTVTGDVVVLAIPYAAVDDVLDAYAAQFDGKAVVDITNPLDFSTFDRLVTPPDGSAAAEIQARVPGAKVLKAFNTTFAATLVNKRVGDLPTTVLVAGDDADAKAALEAVVVAGGLRAVDAGALDRARELEAMGFLQITLAAAEKIGWTGGFAVVP